MHEDPRSREGIAMAAVHCCTGRAGEVAHLGHSNLCMHNRLQHCSCTAADVFSAAGCLDGQPALLGVLQGTAGITAVHSIYHSDLIGTDV